MIAGEIANQTAEAADMIEQFLVDSALWAAIRLAKGVFSSRRVPCAETGESQQAQQRRLRVACSCRLFEVLHRFLVSATFEGNRTEDLERVVAQFTRRVFQRFAGEVAGNGQVFAELGLDDSELVDGHSAGQLVDFLTTTEPCRDPMGGSQAPRVPQRFEKGHHRSSEVR